jgi:hypothetical protein
MTAEEDRPRQRADAERRARRERTRRRLRRRRALAAASLAALIAAVAALALSASSTRTHSRRSERADRRPAPTRPAGAARHAQPASPSPGSLPQTHVFPPATGARFRSLMASLWAGVVADSVSLALPAFFPKAAYVQLKAIGSAASDWSGRLVGDYRLDVGAAHALLGAGAAGAQLVSVNVTSSYGHWVEPGVCYNSIGYYEVPNARVVYREGGQLRSFGIASMISWRGQWYVVHLGAVLRPADQGTVDEPALGPGSSADSGTC